MNTPIKRSALEQVALAKQAGHRVPPIDPNTGETEKRYRVRAVCTPSHFVGLGVLLEHGEQTVIAYESDIENARLNSLEDAAEEDWVAVRKAYERNVERWKASFGEGAKVDMRTCPHSMQEAFRQVMDRDPRPLQELDVLGEVAL